MSTEPEDLSRFKVKGLTLLQLMGVLIIVGVVLEVIANWIF